MLKHAGCGFVWWLMEQLHELHVQKSTIRRRRKKRRQSTRLALVENEGACQTCTLCADFSDKLFNLFPFSAYKEFLEAPFMTFLI